MIVTQITYITSFTRLYADIERNVTWGSDVPQEQAEPQEPPEGMIMLTPYAYLRFLVVPPGDDRTQTMEVKTT